MSMQIVVLIFAVWVCILFTQVFVLGPIELGHLIDLPRSAVLLLALGLFAWLFGE